VEEQQTNMAGSFRDVVAGEGWVSQEFPATVIEKKR